MRLRWSVILPIVGLLLFTLVTIRSARLNDPDESHPHKYFWWSSLRLDTDPLNQHPSPAQPCRDGTANCSQWSPLRDQWVTPALIDRILGISALPAFLFGAVVVAVSSKLGVDEVLSFMVSMPIFLFGWYFFVGWLIERLLLRLRSRREPRGVPLKLV